MNLTKLFIKHKSDKHIHKYDLVYNQYLEKLKDKKLNILEIGISDGYSLKAWAEYFKKSKIIGIDIKCFLFNNTCVCQIDSPYQNY